MKNLNYLLYPFAVSVLFLQVVGSLVDSAQAQGRFEFETSFEEGDVYRVCDAWTDTPEAFSACIEENQETGVEITTYPDQNQLLYPTSWGFCLLNREIDSEFGSNICEI